MFSYVVPGEENEVVENNDDARDIVPVAENPGNQIFFLDQVEQHRQRSNELVRVPNLSRDYQVYYREIVRKTRMLYDAIRIYSVADEEMKNAFGFHKRCRGDLNGGQFAYDGDGILIQGKPLIFECRPSCSCLPNCRNRVTQRGVRHKFEVFRSRTGWGVRSLDYILAGSFLCEYAGVVLTNEQAELVSMGGDNLVYPRRFTERWKQWGDLSQVSPNYVRPSDPEIPPLDFAIDVSILRNVASYISHSRSPNVMVQFVLYDHNNLMFPRLILFAMETIPPFRELSLDYGRVADKSFPKFAICN